MGGPPMHPDPGKLALQGSTQSWAEALSFTPAEAFTILETERLP